MLKPTLPSGRLTRRQVLVAGLVGAIVVLVIAFGTLSLVFYTESTAFCTSCHVMDPEQIAHNNSPHANVNCGTCHIGPGVGAIVESKIASMRYLWEYPTGTYPRPIPSPIKTLRPAKIVCEQCHWPEQFYSDRLVQVSHFGENKTNERTDTYLALKTGGGTARQGLGRGIHWHIENAVWYIAADQQRQTIPWVRVDWQDGTSSEYISTDSRLTEGDIAKATKRRMDCVDCHNRATHIFRSPEEALDQALAEGRISKDVPFVKKEGLAALNAAYQEGNNAQGLRVISDRITNFYKQSEPTVPQDRIQRTMDALQEIYNITAFPEMELSWQTHPDNIGHKDFPGCFRCHDGKHLSAQGNAIRLECNICHTLPQVAKAGQPAPSIPVASSMPEPDSHKTTIWLALHRTVFDETCSGCHDTSNAGGSDNSSFCANSACHGTKWTFAGLDAIDLPRSKASPSATPVPPSPTPTQVQAASPTVPPTEGSSPTTVPASPTAPPPTATAAPAATPTITVPSFAKEVLPIFIARCVSCHGQLAGLNLESFEAVMKGGKSGPAVETGAPEKSLILQKQKTTHTNEARTFTLQELDLITRWIAAGAPNN